MGTNVVLGVHNNTSLAGQLHQVSKRMHNIYNIYEQTNLYSTPEKLQQNSLIYILYCKCIIYNYEVIIIVCKWFLRSIHINYIYL